MGENLVKKVMGVAYMPEDLTGKYTSLSTMNQREQTQFLESDIFSMSGDSWMKEPGSMNGARGRASLSTTTLTSSFGWDLMISCVLSRWPREPEVRSSEASKSC